VSWDDWATIADFATALGTLVLAVATFSAVRSANVSAKVAQASLLIGLRPLLMPTRRDDPAQKVNFGDRKWVRIAGGGAAAEVGDGSVGDKDVLYLAIGLRNAGNGIAVLHGWHFYPDWYRDDMHAPVEEFRRQTRDLWVPVADIGFWQGAFRDTADPQYAAARKVIQDRQPWTVELLYGDHEGGQRCITRFTVLPSESTHLQDVPPGAPDPDPAIIEARAARERGWMATQSRHWNLDRPDPR
jgi:hypothetical protein